MKSNCLNCRKDTKNITKVSNANMVEKQYYQNVQYAVVKNLDLLKINTQKDY